MLQDAAAQECKDLQWGEFKFRLAEAISEHLKPIQERYNIIMDDRSVLDQVKIDLRNILVTVHCCVNQHSANKCLLQNIMTAASDVLFVKVQYAACRVQASAALRPCGNKLSCRGF